MFYKHRHTYKNSKIHYFKLTSLIKSFNLKNTLNIKKIKINNVHLKTSPHNFFINYKSNFLQNKINIVGGPITKFNFDLNTFKIWKLKNISENKVIQIENLITKPNTYTHSKISNSLNQFLLQFNFLKTNSNLKFLQHQMYLYNLNKHTPNFNIILKLNSDTFNTSKNKHSKPYSFLNLPNLKFNNYLEKMCDLFLIKFSKLKYEKNFLKKKRKNLFSNNLTNLSVINTSRYTIKPINLNLIKFINSKVLVNPYHTLKSKNLKFKIYINSIKPKIYTTQIFLLKNYFGVIYKNYVNINTFFKNKIKFTKPTITTHQSTKFNTFSKEVYTNKIVFMKNDFCLKKSFLIKKQFNKLNNITPLMTSKVFKWDSIFNNIFQHKTTNYTINKVALDSLVFEPKSSNFIFQNIGIFLSQQLNLFNNIKYKFKYNIKKKIFSFLKLNQTKQSLMKKKKKIIISRFFLKTKLFSFKFLKFSFKFLKKKFKNYHISTLQNKLFLNKINNTNFAQNSLNFKTSKNDILYRNLFLLKGDDVSFKKSEVHITRIRFKPGYQRLWRDARTALKESLHIKFQYQYRLTRYLTRFFRQVSNYTFNYSEMAIDKIVIYSRLLPDHNTFNIFQENKLIYINGRIVFNKNLLAVENDLIQLIVSKWYYILYRWLTNWTLTRTKKFKKLIYKKGLASKHKLMKNRKQKSQHTPTWIYNLRYDISDVKPYLEVDYFTLSTFVLYEPFLLLNYSSDDVLDSRTNIYKLYNWKYIS